MTDDLPRPLLPEERAALLAVLSHAGFPGRDQLVAQVEHARVSGYCGCGCATVDLTVDRAAPPARGGGGPVTGPIPTEVGVQDEGGAAIGGVLIFTGDGYLTGLEVYSHDEPISPFPPPERLDFTPV